MAQQSALFSIDCPDLASMSAVIITVLHGNSDNQSQTHNTTQQEHVIRCREFIFTDADIVGYPSPDNSKRQFCLIFNNEGNRFQKLQTRFKKLNVQVSGSLPVDHFTFTQAVVYTLQTRLAPQWNRVGHLLVQGRNFVSSTGKFNAVQLDVNMGDDGLRLIVSGHLVSLPQLDLSDLGIPNNLSQEFTYYPGAVIPSQAISQKWVFVLPSLKKASVTAVRRSLPIDSPFATYQTIKRHWKNHYGYRLPENEKDIFYLQVQFRAGQSHLTYPSPCIRGNTPLQHARADPQPAIQELLSDIHSRVPRFLGRQFQLVDTKAAFTTVDFQLGLSAGDLEAPLTQNLTDQMPISQTLYRSNLQAKQVPFSHGLKFLLTGNRNKNNETAENSNIVIDSSQEVTTSVSNQIASSQQLMTSKANQETTSRVAKATDRVAIKSIKCKNGKDMAVKVCTNQTKCESANSSEEKLPLSKVLHCQTTVLVDIAACGNDNPSLSTTPKRQQESQPLQSSPKCDRVEEQHERPMSTQNWTQPKIKRVEDILSGGLTMKDHQLSTAAVNLPSHRQDNHLQVPAFPAVGVEGMKQKIRKSGGNCLPIRGSRLSVGLMRRRKSGPSPARASDLLQSETDDEL